MSLTRAVLLFALAGASSSCALVPQGPSAVAQGRYFSTGNPNYDEFFVRLYRMQVELKAAPDTLASIRRDLARELELPEAADTRAMGAALTKRAGEVSSRGATLAVARGAEPTRARLSVTGTPAEKDRALVKTLEDSLARLGELGDRSGVWQKELEWLPPSGVALDGSVEAAFVGRSRGTRDDVHENLADAQKVAALMATRKKEIAEQGADLERLIVSALGETKPESPAPAPAPEKPKPRSPPRPPVAAAAQPGGTQSVPAATPASGEPPPAPKPKQGTARPDFEP